MLGEMLAQTIERRRDLTVERRLNLGGTFICDRALRSGDIDVYVEYTGTALTAVFHQPVETDPRTRARRASASATREAGLTLLEPLGFENTFAILVRGQDAAALELTTIGDAAAARADWRAGFGYEFLQRADGYPGLAEAYGLQFARAAAGHGPVAHLPRPRRPAGRSDRRRRDERPDRRLRPGDARRTTGTIFRRTTPCRWRGARCCWRIRRCRRRSRRWPGKSRSPTCGG